MKKVVKMVALVVAFTAAWLGFGFKGGKAFLSFGMWTYPLGKQMSELTTTSHVLIAEASNEDDGETDFA